MGVVEVSFLGIFMVVNIFFNSLLGFLCIKWWCFHICTLLAIFQIWKIFIRRFALQHTWAAKADWLMNVDMMSVSVANVASIWQKLVAKCWVLVAMMRWFLYQLVTHSGTLSTWKQKCWASAEMLWAMECAFLAKSEILVLLDVLKVRNLNHAIPNWRTSTSIVRRSASLELGSIALFPYSTHWHASIVTKSAGLRLRIICVIITSCYLWNWRGPASPTSCCLRTNSHLCPRVCNQTSSALLTELCLTCRIFHFGFQIKNFFLIKK